MLYDKIQRAMGVLIAGVISLPAFPAVLVIRAIRPWMLIRFGVLNSARIGHFAANTELYLCERAARVNVPKQRYKDCISFSNGTICNEQLAVMWRRTLNIWPACIVVPMRALNRMIPGWEVHECAIGTQHDRDVYNLLDRFPPHLQFSQNEEAEGEAGLRKLGVPKGAPFICMTVRDSAYLSTTFRGVDYSYHSYRDSDVHRYIAGAEELANRGYYVLRMGVNVNEPMKCVHPMVIDYATNGMRTDFMDIYLGARCHFCISVGTGFDAVPLIFRRPIAYVNMVPLGYLFTFSSKFLGITKHHIDMRDNRELSLEEIFSRGVGFSMKTSEYESKGVRLEENTSDEIRDLVVEMLERLNGQWRSQGKDDGLQKHFWEKFPIDAVDNKRGRRLHGEIRGRFGASFLRDNPSWLVTARDETNVASEDGRVREAPQL